MRINKYFFYRIFNKLSVYAIAAALAFSAYSYDTFAVEQPPDSELDNFNVIDYSSLDVDKDGSISHSDLYTIYDHISGERILTENSFTDADIYKKDGIVDIRDYNILFSKLSNLPSKYQGLGLMSPAALTSTKNLNLSVGNSPKTAYKSVGNTNPISSDIFFADPTAVEYDGRLYVYGTCDQQEYEINGKKGDNSYGKINTLSCYSTEDMKNWTYHGDIKVHDICTWAWCSWAPSCVSRVNDNGVTEFFLYFCNSGGGIGVMKAYSPTGPWFDPIKKPLVAGNTNELAQDPVFWCFDPGVCIDENGDGWLAFGGGDPMHSGESGLYTGNCRLVKLGKDMVSLDSKMAVIPAPYHFEANELNYIDGKYVLTYCSNWFDRNSWPSKYPSNTKPEKCTMCYMVSDDPLNPDLWEYKGEYLKNPTSYGYPFSNNHSHLQKFKGKYYIFYQNVILLRNMNSSNASGYRSIGVNELTVDEKNATFSMGRMTDSGAEQIGRYSPYKVSQAETANVCAGIEYKTDSSRFCVSASSGSWSCITGADFINGAKRFGATVKGKGIVEIRLDGKNGKVVGSIQFDTGSSFDTVYCELSEKVTGVHDIYFVYGGNVLVDEWQFA